MPADEDSDQDDDQVRKNIGGREFIFFKPEEEEDDDDVSHGISASEGESDNEHEGSINLLNFNNSKLIWTRFTDHPWASLTIIKTRHITHQAYYSHPKGMKLFLREYLNIKCQYLDNYRDA